MSVNIKAAFKRDQRHLNGLDEVAGDLIDQPLRRRVIVGVVQVSRVVTDYDDLTRTPVVHFLQIEPLEGSAEETAQRLIAEAYEKRTGSALEDQLDFYIDADDDGVQPWAAGDQDKEE
jgi:hypothetical protein